ncbi:MAG: VOC family protein [Xanthobacter sp.]
MLDHIGLCVSDLERARDFYLTALAPLGSTIAMEVSAAETGDKAHIGFGPTGKPQFWISEGKVAAPVHVGFSSATRAQVDAFHKAALAAGGRDNGAPGLRPHYHLDYYAAFVLDPDGHNIEAVCHRPE